MRDKYYLIYCYTFGVVNKWGDFIPQQEHRTDDFDEHIAKVKELRGQYDFIKTEMRKEEE